MFFKGNISSFIARRDKTMDLLLNKKALPKEIAKKLGLK